MSTGAAVSGGVFGGVLIGATQIRLPKQPYPLILTSLATIIDTSSLGVDVAVVLSWLDGENQPYAGAMALIKTGGVNFVSFGQGLSWEQVQYDTGLFVVTAPLPRDVLVAGVECVQFELLGLNASIAAISPLRYRWRVALDE